MRITLIAIGWFTLTALSGGEALATQKLISGVPDYDQDVFPIDQMYASTERGDCMPVACTMLNGYYDTHGWPRLIPYGGNTLYSGNAWGIDTVVRKYKTEFGFSDGVPTWRTIGGQLGAAIVKVVNQCDPGASFISDDDDIVSFSKIQSYLNADHPCVLAVTPYMRYHFYDDSFKTNSTLQELSGQHTVCAVGWSDKSGSWVICNMGWSYAYPLAWFNADSDDDWYISQITPGGAASGEDDDDYEDNDTISGARSITTGIINNLRCLDTLIVNGDYKASYGDWYKVNVPAGQSLSLTISFTHANGDLDLCVYDPKQSAAGSSNGTGNSETVNVSPTSAGYYYVFVYGKANARNQNYSLTVRAVSLTAISIAGPAFINENGSGQFTATAYFSDGSAYAVPAVWMENSIVTTISASGLLSAGEVTVDTPVVVSAAYTTGGITASATKSVTIINNSSGTCAYTLSALNHSHGAGPENGSVTVTTGTGCSWSAVSGAAWISVVAGANSVGSGTVNYTVAANPDSRAPDIRPFENVRFFLQEAPWMA